MKANLIHLNKIKPKYNYELLNEANSLLRKMIQSTSTKEEQKTNLIVRNVFSSILKRKSGWGTTFIEKVKINEKYLSSIKIDESIESLSKYDVVYWKEANRIISLYEDKIQIRTVEDMMKIHYEIFKETKSFAGKIKTKKNFVEFKPRNSEIQHIEFSDPDQVLEELENLMAFIKSSKYDPFILSALIHAQLIAIHPFEDGNGRFARVISTLVFENNENIFLPIDAAIIQYPSKDIEHNNEEYRYLLNKIHLENKVDEWIDYILEKYIIQIKSNLLLFEKIDSNFNSYKEILSSSKIMKKYQDNIISMLLSELLVTTNKVKSFLNITDRRTCAKILNELEQLKLVKKENSKNGREVSYKVVELIDSL